MACPIDNRWENLYFPLDRESLEILDERTVESSGAVFDIRIAGDVDYAHNGISFPGVV